MKTIEVKEGSWHHRLAIFGGRYLFEDQHNVCAYTRKVLFGVLIVIFSAVLVLSVLFCIGDMLGWLAACASQFMWIEPTPLAGIGAGLVVMVLCIIGVGVITVLQEEKRLPNMPPIVKAAWESFHDKVCFRIEVKAK